MDRSETCKVVALLLYFALPAIAVYLLHRQSLGKMNRRRHIINWYGLLAFTEALIIYLVSFVIMAIAGDGGTLVIVLSAVIYFCLVILLWPFLLLIVYDCLHYLIAVLTAHRRRQRAPGAVHFLFGLS